MAKAKNQTSQKMVSKKQATKKITKSKLVKKVDSKKPSFTYTWLKVQINDKKSIPKARSSHGVSTMIINKKPQVIVFGGENVPRVAIDSQVHTLSLSESKGTVSGKWSSLKAKGKSIPEPRVAHSQAVVGQKLYIFGGRQGVEMGDKDLGDLWTFDVKEKKWEEIKQKGQGPCNRSFHTMQVSQGFLYVFGGCSAEGRMNDLHKFDLKKSTWTKLPSSDKIKGRGGPVFQISPDEKSLYVVAGFAGEETSDVHRFDIASKKWTQLESFPEKDIAKRSVMSASTMPTMNFIQVFGGELEPSARGHDGAGDFNNEVICLDTSKKSQVFEKAVNLSKAKGPNARGWLTSALIQENKSKNYADSIIYGGLSGSDKKTKRNNDTWVLRIQKN